LRDGDLRRASRRATHRWPQAPAPRE